MLRCEDNSVVISFLKNASQNSELLFELTCSLCCHQKATGIVLIFTRCFSVLFADVNLLIYWIPTCSSLKITE